MGRQLTGMSLADPPPPKLDGRLVPQADRPEQIIALLELVERCELVEWLDRLRAIATSGVASDGGTRVRDRARQLLPKLDVVAQKRLESDVLLRPSASPSDPEEVLLRPAQNSVTAGEKLVRPVNPVN